MLVVLGFKRGIRIYLVGLYMYGVEIKMMILKFLYFNIVIKEDLLMVEEFLLFCNYFF